MASTTQRAINGWRSTVFRCQDALTPRVPSNRRLQDGYRLRLGKTSFLQLALGSTACAIS
jgi:hypothetical protein